MRPQPKWLAEKIRANARKFGEAECGSCGAPVLAGLDADVAAVMVMVDRDPVDMVTELRALGRGLDTYFTVVGELHHRHGRGYAVIRHPIHLEHRCPGGTP